MGRITSMAILPAGILYNAFKVMITKLFYSDLSGKKVCQKILRSKSFK